MTWRVHLTNQAIQQLNIIPGKNPQLVAWLKRDRAHFYDFGTGTLLNDVSLSMANSADRTSEAWLNFISETKVEGSPYYLPYIQTPSMNILSTDDGHMRIYQQHDDKLFIEADGVEEPLNLIGSDRLISVDLDGAMGMFVGLDEQLKLHIYQQNIRIGAFDIGLQRADNLRAQVVVSRGGSAIFATDGQHLVQVDSSGTVVKALTAHYVIGQLACSPNGGMVITSDTEAGVLRAYRGEMLVLTHQKFAIDLVAVANQVQLLADLPPIGTALNAIAAHSKGLLAFAMSGVVCVTNVKHMDEVPRPKRLI